MHRQFVLQNAVETGINSPEKCCMQPNDCILVTLQAVPVTMKHIVNIANLVIYDFDLFINCPVAV